MIDLNRIVSYLTISLILLFGIAIVSGILWDFEWKWRLAIGIIIGLYVVVRFWLMSVRCNIGGRLMMIRGVPDAKRLDLRDEIIY